jgi:imidazolonepropionase
VIDSFDLVVTGVDAACMTGDRPFGLIGDAAVAVADGRIAWIGRRADLPDRPARETLDGGGAVLTPGLVDHHTHIVHVGDGLLDFEMLLRKAPRDEVIAAGGGVRGMVAANRQASEEDFYRETAPRIRQMIAAGVTTLESKSGAGLDLETELRQMRTSRALGRDFPLTVVSTYLGAHGIPPDWEGRLDAYVDFMIETVLPAAVAEGLVDQVDGFCDVIGYAPEQLSRLYDAASAHGLPVKAHADQYNESGGGSLVARHRGLSADHLECISEASLAAMAAAGTVAGLLPGANWTLGETRMPPVARFRELGIAMSLATNCNPVSSPTTMPTMIMNMGCIRFGMTPEEAVLGFTRNGARALGALDRAGTLETGKDADLALWDVGHPAELPYRLAHNPCRMTIRAGRVVYRAPALRIEGEAA